MPALTTARRVLMTIVVCVAFASVSVAVAFGAAAQTAAHHTHHPKKCSKPHRDKDGDGAERHGNDHDGCGV